VRLKFFSPGRKKIGNFSLIAIQGMMAVPVVAGGWFI
jgi:hypothetical protein